jgi:hypothetical protein
MTNVVFCTNLETIHHLFLDCHVALFVWRVVQFAFGLQAPTNIEDIFGVWLQPINRKMRPRVCVGVCAIFWSIWLCCNDAVFDEKRLYAYLQVIFSTTYWTRFWTILQNEKHRTSLKHACRMLETVAIEVCAKHG